MEGKHLPMLSLQSHSPPIGLQTHLLRENERGKNLRENARGGQVGTIYEEDQYTLLDIVVRIGDETTHA